MFYLNVLHEKVVPNTPNSGKDDVGGGLTKS